MTSFFFREKNRFLYEKILKEESTMSKTTKRLLKVAGVLALIELTDIYAKGHMLYALDKVYPDEAKNIRNEFAKVGLRGKIINKVADHF